MPREISTDSFNNPVDDSVDRTTPDRPAPSRSPSGERSSLPAGDHRQPFQWRHLVLHLRPSERATLHTLGTFRTVRVDDLARLAYGGDHHRLDNDLRQLRKLGLVIEADVVSALRRTSLSALTPQLKDAHGP